MNSQPKAQERPAMTGGQQPPVAWPARPRSPMARLYLWATHRLYNELAWAYDPVSWLVSLGRWDRWRRLALDYVGDGPILEVGFGTGQLLAQMAHRGWAAYGLDLSPAMQRVTARKLQRLGLSTPRLRSRTQALPFPDNTWDTIISTFPAEYIVEPETLRELARVLRSPGEREFHQGRRGAGVVGVVGDAGEAGEAGNTGETRTKGTGGRLIIVGMWVEIEHPVLQLGTRLLGGAPVTHYLERLQQIGAEAGLEFTVVMREDPPVRVPVIIAQKRAPVQEPGS